jgi:hypothetical protein
LNISTDWTLVLQQEISAQDELIDSLNISLTTPMSPTTSRGGSPLTPEEQESHIAKSQLGFIDVFAEPLWVIGATLFFPGMEHGVDQIRQNKHVWIKKIKPPPAPPHLTTKPIETASSSTALSTEETQSSAKSDGAGIRNVVSSDELKGGKKKRNMRKERSFSSLIFWRKKGREQQQHLQQRPGSE